MLAVAGGLFARRALFLVGLVRAGKPVDVRSVERPPSRLEKLRLVVPEGQGKQAEILGRGPDAAPAVVEVMQKLGVA